MWKCNLKEEFEDIYTFRKYIYILFTIVVKSSLKVYKVFGLILKELKIKRVWELINRHDLYFGKKKKYSYSQAQNKHPTNNFI